MFSHDLRLSHRRHQVIRAESMPAAESEVEVTANSPDLVTACGELLSRLPNDLYAAFKEAINGKSSE